LSLASHHARIDHISYLLTFTILDWMVSVGLIVGEG